VLRIKTSALYWNNNCAVRNLCLWISAHLLVFAHFEWCLFCYYSAYIYVCSKHITVGHICVTRCTVDVAHLCMVVTEDQGNVIISYETVRIKHDSETHMAKLLAWHAAVASKYKLLRQRNWQNCYHERIYQIFSLLGTIKNINRPTRLCLASQDFGVPVHRITCIYGGYLTLNHLHSDCQTVGCDLSQETLRKFCLET
jgi:hypothetical protein